MDQKCKDHGKPLQIFCEVCHSVLCINCLSGHNKNNSCNKWPVSIIEYANDQILPIYKKEVDEFESKKKNIEGSMGTFLDASKRLHEKLIKLKEVLDSLLESINSALEFANSNKKEPNIVIEEMQAKIESEYADLKKAIEIENFNYIIGKIDEKPTIEIEDIASQLINDINGFIDGLIETKELKLLSDSLKLFNNNTKIMVNNQRFVYGNVTVNTNREVLYKYDILSKKLIASINIPYCSSVFQIMNHIFICGGSSPINTLSEFVEESQSLITKQPMKNARYCTSTQQVSSNEFVIIGGQMLHHLSSADVSQMTIS